MKIEFHSRSEERHERHKLISWWDQEKLAKAKVLVVGAGALGNEVIKNLVLLGFGDIRIVDFDSISASNLARMVLFREGDIGKSKAVIAAQRALEINPHLRIEAIDGDLRFELGLGTLRQMDLIFGCLDSVNARWALNRKCRLAGVDWIDAGISDHHAQITHYAALDGACYECTFTDATYDRYNRRYSCPYGLRDQFAEVKVPTTAITASIAAAHQVQKGLMLLHGLDDGLPAGHRLSVFLKPYRMLTDQLPINPECLAHQRVPEEVIEVNARDTNGEMDEIFSAIQKQEPGIESIKLWHDLVVSFACENCTRHEMVMLPRERVAQPRAYCPACGKLRTMETLAELKPGGFGATSKARDLGIASGEILMARKARNGGSFDCPILVWY